MNYYHMWVNLRDSSQDLAWSRAVHNYLEYLRTRGLIENWTLTRRKFGFSPDALHEFHVTVMAKDLAQLDAAFSHVAVRDGEVEQLHRPVYAMVTDFKSALYRDFPDSVRHGA